MKKVNLYKKLVSFKRANCEFAFRFPLGNLHIAFGEGSVSFLTASLLVSL
jgi:hypothetical protein